MPDIQLGAHTIRTHGTQVAKFHMHDWLILMLLVVLEIGLNLIEPFHRFVGEDMMSDLKYPLQDNTIPLWAVPVSFCLRVYWSFIHLDRLLWFLKSYFLSQTSNS